MAIESVNTNVANRRFQFHKRSQDFIGTHNETLSIAVRIHNPDRAPVTNRRAPPLMSAPSVAKPFVGFAVMGLG
jgi:hypothetical protein